MTDPERIAAVFDLDLTITRRDTYVSFLLDVLRRRPQRILRSLHLPVAVAAHELGLRDNTWLKCTFLAAILGGAARSDVRQWAERFADRVIRRGLRTQALPTIEAHRRAGHRVILATASLDVYAERLAAGLGFDDVVSTETEWSGDDRLTGRLRGGNCQHELKVERVVSRLEGGRAAWFLHAYSDSHRDLPLLKIADRAVAVNPTRRLRQAATAQRYEIRDWDDGAADPPDPGIAAGSPGEGAAR